MEMKMDRAERLEQMIIMANSGFKLGDIAKKFLISRQRVNQIFDTNKFDYHSIIEDRRQKRLDEIKENKKRICKICSKEYYFGDDGAGSRYCSRECYILNVNKYHRDITTSLVIVLKLQLRKSFL